MEGKQAAGSQLAATPTVLLEQAARLAGACWAEASEAADERHAATEGFWVQEKKDLAVEISELVADLDKVTAERDAAVTELKTRIAALENQATELVAQAQQASAAELQARADSAEAGVRLAAAETRAETLQKAHDGLLQRIAPEAAGTDERANEPGAAEQSSPS